MAVIHISRDEAAGDFDGLIARARAGDEIVIEENATPVARLGPAATPFIRPMSEVIRLLEESASNATLDGDFGRDVNAGIESHQHEYVVNPWD